MATSAQQATSPIDERPSRDPIGLRIYEAIVAVPVIVAAVWIVASDVSRFANIALLYWVGVISIVELLPVQGWRDLNMTLAEPLLWGFALIAPARVAFVVAFVAAADPREFRREIGVGRALFNRAQLAVSILVCSVLFRELGGDTSHWERLLPLAIAVASIAR